MSTYPGHYGVVQNHDISSLHVHASTHTHTPHDTHMHPSPLPLPQLVNAESYQFLVYLQVVLTNVALNQTWIALLIALICAFPAKAFRLSPVIAAVAGFSSGFFIPVGALHWG